MTMEGIKKILSALPFESKVNECRLLRILDVDYLHLKFEQGDDLFLTDYGMRFIGNLLPQSFYQEEWFRNHSQRLAGTSCVYKVTTRPIHNRRLDIVLKWNRMAQDVPGGTHLVGSMTEFNSPFEEFSLVMELRKSRNDKKKLLYTHKPLGIFVPGEKVEAWRLGRKEWVMKDKIKRHTDIELDMLRNYAVMYEWIKGIDAAMASQQGLLDASMLEDLTDRVDREMSGNGFMVSDRKPHHIIVRETPQNQLLKDRQGQTLYALIDFELLHRTDTQEKAVRTVKRGRYLTLQANRFHPKEPIRFPSHIQPVEILGVDYVYGRTESTGGALWVVGKDPELFDYFLPERWRTTPQTKLSLSNQTFHTVTKDNINLVWNLSRVGELPDMDPFKSDEKRILDYGYNSPFEEIALAIELSKKGILTTYPRAIYMSGQESGMPHYLLDKSRYATHQTLLTPEGKPLLLQDREYVSVWGYWNGPDEMLAVRDGNYYKGIDALRALREGFISQEMYLAVMENTRKKLFLVGIEDLNLRGNHLLLSLDPLGKLVYDSHGEIEVRISRFELLKKVG